MDFVQQLILGLSNYQESQINPDNFFMNNHMKYITGRNMQTYLKHLYPSFKYEKCLLKHLRGKKILDLGSGLNHLLPQSFISKLNKQPRTWAKGIDIVNLPNHRNFLKQSLFHTNLRNSFLDLIVCQYVLYSHVNSVELLKKTFKEVHRILKKGGEIRIYPVYFGNYSLGDKNFEKWIRQRFQVKTIDPSFYIDTQKKKCLLPCTGKYETFSDSYWMEKARHELLDVKTIILKKL